MTTKIDVILDESFSLEGGDIYSSERTLFLAVVLQALLDATKQPYEGEPDQCDIDRRHARAWFKAPFGVTSEDFEEVCDYAGLDPEYTRSFAFKIIESKEVSFVRKRINALLTHS